MNNTISSAYLQDPSFNQVKVRKQHQSHEYVVPSQFVSIPTQTRMMKNTHRHYKKKRFSMPPPIREEEEAFADPVIIQNGEEEDDEDIPLAVLAYRKGFKVPVKVENAFPLIQHVHPNKNIQQFEYPHYYYCANPCFNSPSSMYYHPANMNRSNSSSFYQLNNNSGLSYSPSSSNSSLSSIENMSSRSNSSGASKYYRRQSSHF